MTTTVPRTPPSGSMLDPVLYFTRRRELPASQHTTLISLASRDSRHDRTRRLLPQRAQHKRILSEASVPLPQRGSTTVSPITNMRKRKAGQGQRRTTDSDDSERLHPTSSSLNVYPGFRKSANNSRMRTISMAPFGIGVT